MHYPRYELSVNDDFTVFGFISMGQKGRIQKAIKYSMTLNPQVYNLGFGDIISVNETTGEVEIDDQTISNNGDIRMVLSTVAHSVYIFTQHHPDVLVLFGGGNKAKVRLYRMVLSKYYEEVTQMFVVYCAVRNVKGQIINVPFSPHEDVEGFFIRRK